ncbi:MAG: PAS domain S-box protein [Halobacteria archaeon]|nr:PAS domain S-box protein [Halobacteria archaeon]
MNIIPGSIHVLHVDDEPGFAELASEFLERENDRITVETATSANEGLEYLAENDFDCIISDYDMPGQDGIEFLRAVRNEYPDLPFILFTGKGSEEVASEAISAGVTDYLQKRSGTDQYKILANRLENYVERSRAQREHQAMRERMELALEHTNSIIFEVDLDTGAELRHGSFEDIFGIPVERVPTLEKHQELAVHPEDREKVREFFQQLADGERESGNLEYRTNPETGKVRWIRDIVHVESDGDSRRVIGLARDITERKEREKNLERYEKIVENSDDGIYVFDDEGRFEFVNQRVADVSGIPQEAWVGEHVSIHTDLGTLSQEEVTAIEDAIKELIQGDEDEVRLELTPDVPHDLETLELRLTPFESDDVSGSIIAFTRDITERKSYERELETIRERIGFALDATDSIIYEIDLDTGEETRHGPFERLYGVSPDQISTSWEFYDRVVHPDDRDELEKRQEKMAQGEADSFDIEYRLHPDLFENRWMNTRGYVKTGPDGNPLQMIGLTTDITRLKEKEEELRESMRKIEALHDMARRIGACETEQEICDLTIEGAEDILEFDICVINLEEDGYLPITSISSDVPPEGATKMSVDEGIAGKTYRTGESFLIEDVQEHEGANPQGPYRSAISVPVGDYGVFQAVSEEVGFFDGDDLELAELLVSHTAEALNRVETENRLRRERDRFAVIFENIPDPAMRVEFEDEEPVVKDVNPAFERFSGTMRRRS